MSEPTSPAATATPCPRDVLLATLRRTALLPTTTLDDVAGRADCLGDDAKPLIRHLFQAGLLTRYQLAQAALGRDDDLVVGPYLLLDRIAEGGAGQVFRARHRVMNRIVALKRMRPEALARPELVERFFQEAQVAAQLDHPNVVRAYDAGQTGGACFLAMEFVDGMDLTRLVTEGGPLPIPVACEFARQAALSLQHAADRGLVHRDVKPSNFLASPITRATPDAPPRPAPGAQVKLLDLGLARYHTAGSADKGPSMGSPHFVAPEQIRNADAADARSDLYALGGTLYFLLTGQTPFTGTSAELVQAHMSKTPPRIETVRPSVPPELADLIARLLEKDPTRRPQSAHEVIDRLAQISGGLSGASTRPTPVPQPIEVPFDFGAAPADDAAEILDEQPLSDFPVTRPVSPRATIAPTSNNRRAMYLAIGIALHIAAAVIVAGILLWRWNRPNSAAEEKPAPKPPPVVIAPPADRDPPTTTVPPLSPSPKKSTEPRPKPQPSPVGENPQLFARGTPPPGLAPMADVPPAAKPADNAAFPKDPPPGTRLADAPAGEVRLMEWVPGSPGGLLTVGSEARLLEPTMGKLIATLEGAAEATHLIATPDGKRVCGIVGRRVVLWPLDPVGPPTPLPAEAGPAVCLTMSSTRPGVLFADGEGLVKLWSFDRNQIERQFKSDDVVTSLAIAPNGWLAVAGSRHGEVSFWDLESQSRLAGETRHTGPIRDIAITADGSLAVSAGVDGKLFVWSLTNGRRKTFFDLGQSLLGVRMLSPSWGATATQAGKLVLFNIEDRRQHELTGDRFGPAQSLTADPAGQSIYVAFEKAGLYRLDLGKSAPPPSKPTPAPPPKVADRPPLSAATRRWEVAIPKSTTVRAIRFTNDSQSLVVGTRDGNLTLYPTSTGKPPATIASAFDPAGGLAVIANRFVTGTGIADRSSKNAAKHGASGAVTAVGASGPTMNDVFAVGTDAGAIYRVKPGVPTYNVFWPVFSKPVRAVTMTKDNRVALAVVGEQLFLLRITGSTAQDSPLLPVAGRARYLQVVEPTRAVFADDKSLLDVTFMPDGANPATSRYTLPDGTLRAASADATHVVAGVGDTIVLYKAGQPEPIDRLALPRDTMIVGIDFAPDGRSLALATDNSLIVWTLDPPLTRPQ